MGDGAKRTLCERDPCVAAAERRTVIRRRKGIETAILALCSSATASLFLVWVLNRWPWQAVFYDFRSDPEVFARQSLSPHARHSTLVVSYV